MVEDFLLLDSVVVLPVVDTLLGDVAMAIKIVSAYDCQTG